MPTMSRFQAAFCRSRPWRALSGNAVLPWSLQEFEPRGDVSWNAGSENFRFYDASFTMYPCSQNPPACNGQS